MLGDVETFFFHFRSRAEAHHHFNHEGDDGRGNHAPDDGESDGFELGNQKAFLKRTHDGVRLFVSEDTGQDGTKGTADAMHTEGVQSVVVAKSLLEDGHTEVGNHTGEDAHDDCGVHGHETSSRGDNHQAAHDAGAEAKHARLATQHPLKHAPHKASNRCCKGGGSEGVGSDGVSAKSGASVEAVPANQSMPVPTMQSTMLCGAIGSLP